MAEQECAFDHWDHWGSDLELYDDWQEYDEPLKIEGVTLNGEPICDDVSDDVEDKFWDAQENREFIHESEGDHHSRYDWLWTDS